MDCLRVERIHISNLGHEAAIPKIESGLIYPKICVHQLSRLITCSAHGRRKLYRVLSQVGMHGLSPCRLPLGRLPAVSNPENELREALPGVCLGCANPWKLVVERILCSSKCSSLIKDSCSLLLLRVLPVVPSFGGTITLVTVL